MNGHRTHHQGHHGIGRDTQSQQGDEGSLRTRIVGSLRRGHTADVALAERHFAWTQAGFLFDGVSRKSCQQSTAAWQHAQNGAQSCATQHRRHHVLEVFLGGEQTFHLGREHFSIVFRFGQVGNDLAITKHAHRHDHETYTVGEFGNVKAETCHARVHVRADQAHQEAQHDHGNRFEQGARSQYHRTNQAQNHEREIFGRAKLEREFCQRRRKGGQDQGTHRACEEGTQTSGSQRGTSSTFSGHLVTVNGRHHRGRFTWQVDQNRGG